MPELTFDDLYKIPEDIRSQGGPGEVTREINRKVIEVFRATRGQMSGDIKGAQFLLVTMIGARSERERTVPLGYVEHEGRLFIVASRAATEDNPVWYYNLKANPQVTVEYKDQKMSAVAVELRGDERHEIFQIAKQQWPDYADYEKMVARTIPLIELRKQA